MTTANRLVLILYGGICVGGDWTNHQAAEPKLSVIFDHVLFSVIHNFSFMIMLFMRLPLNLSLRMHQIDAFNYKMCKIFFWGGGPCTIVS